MNYNLRSLRHHPVEVSFTSFIFSYPQNVYLNILSTGYFKVVTNGAIINGQQVGAVPTGGLQNMLPVVRFILIVVFLNVRSWITFQT